MGISDQNRGQQHCRGARDFRRTQRTTSPAQRGDRPHGADREIIWNQQASGEEKHVAQDDDFDAAGRQRNDRRQQRHGDDERRFLSRRPPGDGHADQPDQQRKPPTERRQPRPIGQRNDQLRIDAQAVESQNAIRARRRLNHVDFQTPRPGHRVESAELRHRRGEVVLVKGNVEVGAILALHAYHALRLAADIIAGIVRRRLLAGVLLRGVQFLPACLVGVGKRRLIGKWDA